MSRGDAVGVRIPFVRRADPPSAAAPATLAEPGAGSIAGGSDGAGAPDALGGYRVLRRLARGDRADVLLARAPESDAVVVLKVLPATCLTSALAEATALTRARGAHVLGLVDVASGAAGECVLVLERLSTLTLAALLVERESLSPGEAVTILAPLAAALARAHRAGVAHGDLSAAEVRFADDGAPVIAGWSRARLIAADAPPIAREQEPAFAADVRALATLARAVLDRVPASTTSIALLRVLDESPPLELPRILADRVFELGDGQPIRRARREHAPTPGRLALGIAGPPVPPTPEPQRGWMSTALAALPLPERVRLVVEELEQRLPSATPDGLRGAVRSVRPRFWVAAALPVVLLVGALALVPSGEGAAESPGATESTGVAESTGDAEPTGSQPEAASGSDGAQPTAPGAADDQARTPGPGEQAGIRDAAVVGDDPVAALEVLLTAREECVRALSVLCLDAVDHADSALFRADVAAIRAMQDGSGEAPPMPEATGARLVESLGGSALVELAAAEETAPASVLMIRTEAGWRIRELLPAGP